MKFHVLGIIIPTDELIFFGVAQAPSSKEIGFGQQKRFLKAQGVIDVDTATLAATGSTIYEVFLCGSTSVPFTYHCEHSGSSASHFYQRKFPR